MKRSSDEQLNMSMKITKAALKGVEQFDIDELVKLCYASGNPVAAIETLLGEYVQPEFVIPANKFPGYSNNRNCSSIEFLEYNRYADTNSRVLFSYSEPKRVGLYYDKDVYKEDSDAEKAFNNDPDAWNDYKEHGYGFTWADHPTKKELKEGSCSEKDWREACE